MNDHIVDSDDVVKVSVDKHAVLAAAVDNRHRYSQSTEPQDTSARSHEHKNNHEADGCLSALAVRLRRVLLQWRRATAERWRAPLPVPAESLCELWKERNDWVGLKRSGSIFDQKGLASTVVATAEGIYTDLVGLLSGQEGCGC